MYRVNLDKEEVGFIENLAIEFAKSMAAGRKGQEIENIPEDAINLAIDWFKNVDNRVMSLAKAFPSWLDVNDQKNFEDLEALVENNYYWYISHRDNSNNHGKSIVKHGKFMQKSINSNNETVYYFGDFENGSYKEIPNKASHVLVDPLCNNDKDFHPSLPIELN